MWPLVVLWLWLGWGWHSCTVIFYKGASLSEQAAGENEMKAGSIKVKCRQYECEDAKKYTKESRGWVELCWSMMKLNYCFKMYTWNCIEIWSFKNNKNTSWAELNSIFPSGCFAFNSYFLGLSTRGLIIDRVCFTKMVWYYPTNHII